MKGPIRKKSRLLVPMVWIAGVVGVWELVAFLLAEVLKDPQAANKLPYLHDVIVVFVQNADTMLQAGEITLSRAVVGFLLGISIGFILAVLMSLSKIIEKIAMPYLLIMQMIPILGLAPIIFSLVKDLDTSRIVIATYISFYPIAINMLSGFQAVAKDRKDLLYTYAAKQPVVYLKLMFPSALPSFFTGMKIAAPMAVTASILVDMLSNKDGIGAIMIYSLYGGGDKFWPAVLTGIIMGILSTAAVSLLEWLCVPWERHSRQREGDSV
ncbi:MAG: ABC transporter permease subunit [Oscillospiraceae bacterium]|nr:ABC transporter permease subunit [Oscillospiraceae bacterium]